MKPKSSKKEIGEESFPKVAFYTLLIFSVLILPLVHSFKILDTVLMVRLLALAGFLIVFGAIFFNPKSILKFNIEIVKHHLFKFWIAYLVVSAGSLFFAINFKEGLFDISKTAVMLIFTVFSCIIFYNKKKWMEVLPVFVAISGLIAVTIGFSQYFDKVFMQEHLERPGELPLIYQVNGLMAHKNQFSISLFLMLPFIIYGIYIFRDWRRWISILSFILISILLILLKTRAVWLGGLIALPVAMAILVYGYKQFGLSTKFRNNTIYSTLLLIITGSLMIVFINNNQYINRLKSITQPGLHDNIYRLMIWESTLKMALDHPITGVGAGNWQFNLPKYLKGKNFQKEQLNWIRPHNDFLWVLTEKGFIGFILYLSLFAFIIVHAFKIIRKNGSINDKVFALLILFGLTGYLVDAFFDFPYERINQQVFLSLFFSTILVISPKERISASKAKSIERFLAIPVIPVLMFVIIFSVQAMQVEIHIRKAKIGLLQKNYEIVLKEGLAARKPLKNLDPEAVPVHWYIGLGYFEKGDFKSAIKHYQIAKRNNPAMITVYNNLGQAYFKIGELKKAEANYRKALDILPRYREALFNLSTLYYTQKKYGKALKSLLAIQKMNPAKDIEITKRITYLRQLIKERNRNSVTKPKS